MLQALGEEKAMVERCSGSPPSVVSHFICLFFFHRISFFHLHFKYDSLSLVLRVTPDIEVYFRTVNKSFAEPDNILKVKEICKVFPWIITVS